MGHGEAFALRAIPLHLLGLILFVILVPYVHAAMEVEEARARRSLMQAFNGLREGRW